METAFYPVARTESAVRRTLIMARTAYTPSTIPVISPPGALLLFIQQAQLALVNSRP